MEPSCATVCIRYRGHDGQSKVPQILREVIESAKEREIPHESQRNFTAICMMNKLNFVDSENT